MVEEEIRASNFMEEVEKVIKIIDDVVEEAKKKAMKRLKEEVNWHKLKEVVE
jgi:hypothetical protein